MTINVVPVLWIKTPPQEICFAFKPNISEHFMNISKISLTASLLSR